MIRQMDNDGWLDRRMKDERMNGQMRAGSLTLVMDGVLTMDRRCFFGFLTSYSSSSRS